MQCVLLTHSVVKYASKSQAHHFAQLPWKFRHAHSKRCSSSIYPFNVAISISYRAFIHRTEYGINSKIYSKHTWNMYLWSAKISPSIWVDGVQCLRSLLTTRSLSLRSNLLRCPFICEPKETPPKPTHLMNPFRGNRTWICTTTIHFCRWQNLNLTRRTNQKVPQTMFLINKYAWMSTELLLHRNKYWK